MDDDFDFDETLTPERMRQLLDNAIMYMRLLPPILRKWQVQEAYRHNQTLRFHCKRCGGWSPELQGDNLIWACPDGEYECWGQCEPDFDPEDDD